MLLAAALTIKVISERLGHAHIVFTADVYTEVVEELDAAATAVIAAYIPRRSVSANAVTQPGSTPLGG